MADAAPVPERASPTMVLTVALVIGLLLVGVYYFAGTRYYLDRYSADPVFKTHAAGMARDAVMARLPWFTLVALLVTMGSALAAMAPRRVAAGLVGVFAVGNLAAALLSTGSVPSLLAITILVFGVLFAVFGWLLFWKGSRAAWAALIAMTGVMAGVNLFGSTKIGKLLAVNVWVALIPMALYIVGTVALRGAVPRDEPATARQ